MAVVTKSLLNTKSLLKLMEESIEPDHLFKVGDRVRLKSTGFTYFEDEEEDWKDWTEGIMANGNAGTVKQAGYAGENPNYYIEWDGYQGLWCDVDCVEALKGPRVPKKELDEAIASIERTARERGMGSEVPSR